MRPFITQLTDGEYWFKVYGTADAEDYIMTAPYHIIEKN